MANKPTRTKWAEWAQPITVALIAVCFGVAMYMNPVVTTLILKALFMNTIVYHAFGFCVVLKFLCGLSLFGSSAVFFSMLLLLLYHPFLTMRLEHFDMKDHKDWHAGNGPMAKSLPPNIRGAYFAYGNVGADHSEFDTETGLLVKGKLAPSIYMDFTHFNSYNPQTRTLEGGYNTDPYLLAFADEKPEPLAGYVWNHSGCEGCKPFSVPDWQLMIPTRMHAKVVFTEDFREFELQYYLGDQPMFKAPGPPVAPAMQIGIDRDGTGRVWERQTFIHPEERGVAGKVSRYELRRVIDADGNIDQENWDLMTKMWGTKRKRLKQGLSA